MILPANDTSAILLLLVSLLCFGSWVNTFKLAGPRWRFELYSIDFAAGITLISLLAAFTLGSVGSDLSFSDRLLVAGRSSQAFVVAAGFLFSLGNMLLLAAVSLLGVSGAFPIGIGSALVVGSLFSFRTTNGLFFITGIVLIIVSIVLDVAACRIRDASNRKPVAAKTPGKLPAKPANKRTGKGLFLAIFGGIILGFFYPIAAKGMTGDLALGPYAGMLMFSIGVLISTVVFDFYFLNIAIDGGPLKFSAYFQGVARQHFLGLAGGALWAVGALAASLALAIPVQTGFHPALKLILPAASVLLALLWGAFGWREFKAAPASAKRWLGLAAAFFVGGVVLIGLGLGS